MNKEEIKRYPETGIPNIPRPEVLSEKEKMERIRHNARILADEVWIADKQLEDAIHIKLMGDITEVDPSVCDELYYDELISCILIAQERMATIKLL